MSTEHNAKEPRVFGNREGLRGDIHIDDWAPRTRSEVASITPLPAPPPRPGLERTPAAMGDPAAMPKASDERPVPAEAETQRDTPAPKQAPPPRPARPGWIEDDSVQARVWERPEDAARLVRTIMLHDGGGQEESEPTAMQRIAILFVALGQETCGEIFKFSSDYEIEEITRAVAGLKAVSAEMQDKALAEFEQHLLAGEWVSEGGMEFARGALERAVGPRKAKEILDRVAVAMTSGFSILRNVTPEQVAPFISHEHPQTIALILSQVVPAQAAGILALLPERIQIDVSYRIATLENVTPAVMKLLEEAIEASLRDVIGGNHDVGGPKVLADILNLSSSAVEKSVLDAFEDSDAGVSESVKNLMYVFHDIIHLTDPELQKLLGEVAPDDWAIALKATQEPLKERLRANMAEETWQKLAERMEYLGPMRLGAVEEVQLRIVQCVRQLEKKGEVTITRAPDDETFV